MTSPLGWAKGCWAVGPKGTPVCPQPGRFMNARGVVGHRAEMWDVLIAIRSLRTATNKKEFTTAEAYGFAPELEKLHPDNRHVKDKIRQQLQVLRDMGLLVHVGRGIWRLV